MSDLISRQAAIDAECEVCQIAPKKERGHNCTYYVHGCKEIECLRALPSAQPEPCEDAVSRNAVIQKLNTMDRYVSEGLRLCDTDKKFPKNEVFIVDDVYEEIVENLPSVQPELYCAPQPDLSDDGTLMITVPNGMLNDVKRVLVDEVGTKDCKVMYQDEPERKRGE